MRVRSEAGASDWPRCWLTGGGRAYRLSYPQAHTVRQTRLMDRAMAMSQLAIPCQSMVFLPSARTKASGRDGWIRPAERTEGAHATGALHPSSVAKIVSTTAESRANDAAADEFLSITAGDSPSSTCSQAKHARPVSRARWVALPRPSGWYLGDLNSRRAARSAGCISTEFAYFASKKRLSEHGGDQPDRRLCRPIGSPLQ